MISVTVPMYHEFGIHIPGFLVTNLDSYPECMRVFACSALSAQLSNAALLVSWSCSIDLRWIQHLHPSCDSWSVLILIICLSFSLLHHSHHMVLFCFFFFFHHFKKLNGSGIIPRINSRWYKLKCWFCLGALLAALPAGFHMFLFPFLLQQEQFNIDWINNVDYFVAVVCV